MYPRKSAVLAAGAMSFALSAGPSHAISILFDYTYDTSGFFPVASTPRSLLESAGAYFSAALGDSLTAITSLGSDSFDVTFDHPGTGAATMILDYSVAADTVVVFAGARELGATLGVGGPGGFGVSGSMAFVDNAFTRGELGADDSPATDFGPWGGTVAFDTTTSWYFDTDPLTVEAFPGMSDFYSVALHELAHLLGIGTADSWDDAVSGATFTGADSVAEFGGAVPLAADLSHWASGTMSTVPGDGAQEAAMDPSITTGTRKYITDLDCAGLSDVGWEVSCLAPAAVPLPAAVWLLGAGCAGLFGYARRRAAA